MEKSYMLTLLETIQKNAPVSKRQLQDITGFSWGLTSRLTNELADNGYIVSARKVDSGVGRRPDEFDINPYANYFIGVDFSSARAMVAVTDMKGCVVDRYQLVWKEREKESVLQQLFELLDIVVEKYEDNRILGIGFAAQGVVNVEKGISVYIGGLKNWHDVPFKAMVEERYGVKGSVAHDPDCLMQCERTFGLLKGSDIEDVVMLHFTQGVSIGMSVFLNGKFYLGHHEKAGEVGHTILGKLPDGRYDFMDNHVNKGNIEKDYRQLAPEQEPLSYKEIVERAKEGDEVCKKVFEHIYHYIAQSTAIVNSILNPELIVINTVGCENQDLLMDTVEEYLRTVSYDKSVKLKLSRLGEEAKAVGAALMNIENVISEMF